MQKGFEIVFEHHGDPMPGLPVGISVVNSDGTGRRLFRETGSTPVWSPDGRWIAFNDVPEGYEGYATNIFVMRPDRKGVKQLTFHKDAAAYRPRWHSDSKSIVYSLYIDRQYQVFALDIRSGKVQQITHRGSLAYPEWTSDGEIVALDRSNHPSPVVVMSSEGLNIRHCALFQPGDEEMVWSPDGRMIAFNRYGHLCFMNADGTDLREFQYGGPGKTGVLGISWMPGASGVAFSGNIRGNPGAEYDDAGKELFLFDLSSCRERPLVTNPAVGAPQQARKQRYAEIIDVSCSPLISSQPGGLLSRLFGKRS